jgi:hypothetical protein
MILQYHKQTNNNGKQRYAFDKGSRYNHRHTNVANGFRLTGYALHCRTAYLSYSQTCPYGGKSGAYGSAKLCESGSGFYGKQYC